MSESMSRAHPASETCCEIGVRCQGPGQGGAAQAFRGKRFGADSEFIVYHTARDKSDAYNWGLVLPGLGTGKDAQVGTAWELGSEVAQFVFLGWDSNPHPLTPACCAPSPVTTSGMVFLLGPGTHGLGVAPERRAWPGKGKAFASGSVPSLCFSGPGSPRNPILHVQVEARWPPWLRSPGPGPSCSPPPPHPAPTSRPRPPAVPPGRGSGWEREADRACSPQSPRGETQPALAIITVVL